MKCPTFPLSALVFLLAMSMVHCASFKKASAESDVDPNTITDVASLVEYLRKSRVSLIEEGPFTSPEMTTPGYAFTPTSGGRLYVFEYSSDVDALAALTWIRDESETARYSRQVYRKEGLVVAYWGEDPRIERALVRVFGSRVA